MTKRKGYKRYSPEFKREALKRASEEGVTDVIVCEELGVIEWAGRPRMSKIDPEVLPRSSGHLGIGAIMRWEVSDDKEEAI